MKLTRCILAGGGVEAHRPFLRHQGAERVGDCQAGSRFLELVLSESQGRDGREEGEGKASGHHFARKEGSTLRRLMLRAAELVPVNSTV